MVKANIASEGLPEIHIDRFIRRWVNERGDQCFVFETIEDVDTTEVTQGNQKETSSFRILREKDSGLLTVETIGDSSEGGFLVCEDASDLFDTEVIWTLALASLSKKDPPWDAQAEYDEWVAEEDDECSR